MTLDRADGNREAIGDLTVGQACRNEIRDFTFAGGQWQGLGCLAQSGRARTAAGRGETVRGGRGFEEPAAVTGAFVGGCGLGGGIGGGEHGADALEFGCGRVESGSVVSRECHRMAGLDLHQFAVDPGGQVGESACHRMVAEAGGRMQRHGLDGVLMGARRRVGGAHGKSDAGVTVPSAAAAQARAISNCGS